MTPPQLLFLLAVFLGKPSDSEMPLDAWTGRAGECAYSITAWDSGERSEVTGRYGADAEGFVESCRLFLDSLKE